jgi:hypothetical protein
MRFKIVAGATNVYFYITTRTNGEKLVATIQNNVDAGSSLLYPGVYLSQMQGGGGTRGIDVRMIGMKWRIGL